MPVKELRDIRKEMFAEMEQRLNVNRKPEDSFFYYHSNEDRIVLSHALFWVMTQNKQGTCCQREVLPASPPISRGNAKCLSHGIR